MEQTSTRARPRYEQPELRALGTVQGLTQQDKRFGPTDGMTWQGVDITNNSAP
jgi:hypothetical protein